MGKLKFKKNSLSIKMLIPMVLVLLTQTIVILLSIFLGGVFSTLDNSAISLLAEKTNNRMNYLSTAYFNKWTNLDESYKAVNSLCDKVIKQSSVTDGDLSRPATYDDLYDTAHDSLRFNAFTQLDDILIAMLRQNMVNGGFIMFVDTDLSYQYGLYIRDDDPDLNSFDNSDLFLQVATSSYSQISTLKTSPSKTSFFDFEDYSASNTDYDYVNKPIAAAKDYFSSHERPDINISNLSYTSGLYAMNHESTYKIISYTMPLINEKNEIYGILGIDLTDSYLKKLLPANEINDTAAGAYSLSIVNEKTKTAQKIANTGSYYIDLFGTDFEQYSITKKDIADNTCEITTQNGLKAISVNYKLKIHNTDTYFEDEYLMLSSFVDSDVLFSFSNTVGTILMVVTIVSFFICLVIILLSTKLFTKPITSLTNEVMASTPASELSLKRTNIAEIDEFATAIERLNRDVREASFTTQKIIDLTDMPIAAFEIDEPAEPAFYSRPLFELFNGSYVANLNSEQLETFINSFDEHIINDNPDMGIRQYHMPLPMEKWLQMNYIKNKNKILGVVRDITEETLEKMQLEKERDYDGLTDLLNRRAFLERIEGLNEDDLKTAAFIMMDIDNLKYINDNYGHDFGDTYIITIANILKTFALKTRNALVARMSGDEFYICVYGFDSREDATALIDVLKAKLSEATFNLSDGSSFCARASAGISWYPENSKDMKELLKYADYAMYETKTTVKGEFRNFDYSTYIKGADLLKKREDLNYLIDKQMIDFHFQPIISTADASILGYEALMRSKIDSFATPTDIINAAKSQYKLWKIEELTLSKSLSVYSSNIKHFGNKKLFINSISNQIVSPKEIKALENKYGDLLRNIVIEFTENERIDDLFTRQKKNYIQRWHAQIALDDFASGYNSETVLLKLHPDYVKIDINIIGNIHNDANRQMIVSNIVGLAKNLGIVTIAEGVETSEELKCVMQLGVDYIQGFYLAMPTDIPCPLDKKIIKEILSYKKILNDDHY